MNACAYNLSWGRVWQLARNWKTSKHPHVFEDEDGLHIHSFFFFEDAEDHAGNSTVAFTIRDGRLFTLRARTAGVSSLPYARPQRAMVDGNAYELLLDLFETKIEQLADEIENIYSDLEKLSRVIMEGHQGDEYDEALSRWRSWKISAGRCVCV